MELRSIRKFKIWKMEDLELFDRRTEEVTKQNFYIEDDDEKSALERIFDHVDQLGFSYCGYKCMKSRTIEMNLNIMYECADEEKEDLA